MHVFSFHCYADHRDLHSFPTRRSSDLQLGRTEPPHRLGLDGILSYKGVRFATTWEYRSGHSRSEEHTSELQSRENLVCRLLLEKKNKTQKGGCSGRDMRGTQRAQPHERSSRAHT